MRLIDADALIRKFKTVSPMAIDGRARQMVEEMPTIEPERKKGHWVCKMDKDPIGYNVKVYVCSECRKMYYRSANYCSNCGADMRGEQDETD